jgi:hypothetical protein
MNKMVAMHFVPSLTKSGFYCARYPDTLIVVGSNPAGPKGGHNGKWMDGTVVARYKFGDRKYANLHISKLIGEGYTQI